MKPLNHSFKNFSKELFIYLAGGELPVLDDAPKIDSQVENVATVTELSEDSTALEIGSEKQRVLKSMLDKKKDIKAAIDKIDMDANPDIQTQQERLLAQQLTNQSDQQFQLLEHNYKLAVDTLGAGSEAITKAEEKLSSSVDNFVNQVELRVLKESMANANDEIMEKLVERIFSEKGGNFSALRGLSSFMVDGAREPGISSQDNPFKKIKEEVANGTLKNHDEISARLTQLLTEGRVGDKPLIEVLMEQTLDRMKEAMPSIDTDPNEENYFKTLFEKTKADGANRLTYQMGSNQEIIGQASTMLSKRFDVRFKADPENPENIQYNEEPEYIVDLLTNEVYKPGPQWMAKLKNICHTELKDAQDIQTQEKQLNEMKQKREADISELQTDIPWTLDNEIQSFDDLGGDSFAQLYGLLEMTTTYHEGINQNLEREIRGVQTLASQVDINDSESGSEMVKISTLLTPEKIRQTGLLGQLGELIRMLQAAITGKDNLKLSAVTQDLEQGKNPIQTLEQMDKDEKMFSSLVEGASLQQLLQLHKEPSHTTTVTALETAYNQGKEGEKKIDAPDSLSPMQAQLMKKAVNAKIQETFGIERVEIRTSNTDNSMTLVFEKGGVEYQITTEGEKITFQKGEEAARELEGDQAKLDHLVFLVTGKKTEAMVATEREAAEKEAQEALRAAGEKFRGEVKTELLKLAKAETYGKGNRNPSPLGKLINQLAKDNPLSKNQPKWDKAFLVQCEKGGIKTVPKKQQKIDQMRADYMTKEENFVAYKPILEKDKRFASLFKPSGTAAS